MDCICKFKDSLCKFEDYTRSFEDYLCKRRKDSATERHREHRDKKRFFNHRLTQIFTDFFTTKNTKHTKAVLADLRPWQKNFRVLTPNKFVRRPRKIFLCGQVSTQNRRRNLFKTRDKRKKGYKQQKASGAFQEPFTGRIFPARPYFPIDSP
jgi:hypothetical protein